MLSYGESRLNRNSGFRPFVCSWFPRATFLLLLPYCTRELVKQEYQVIILGQFFLFLYKNICCGYSLEAPRRGASNEYPQHMFLWRTGENYPRIIIKYSSLSSPQLYQLIKVTVLGNFVMIISLGTNSVVIMRFTVCLRYIRQIMKMTMNSQNH